MLPHYLSTHFDFDVPACGAIKPDFARIVNYDDKGAEFITFEKVDNAKVVASNGTFEDWKLDSLMKAGIDPAFPISTGLNTRLEGVGMVSQFEKVADEILNDKTE